MAEYDNPFDDPLREMAEMPSVVVPKRRRPAAFDQPLRDVTAGELSRVTTPDSQIAGRYIRRTFTFTPGQLRRIRELAAELGLSENGAARWLIDEGLAQYDAGARPEIVAQTVKAEPRLREW